MGVSDLVDELRREQRLHQPGPRDSERERSDDRERLPRERDVRDDSSGRLLVGLGSASIATMQASPEQRSGAGNRELNAKIDRACMNPAMWLRMRTASQSDGPISEYPALDRQRAWRRKMRLAALRRPKIDRPRPQVPLHPALLHQPDHVLLTRLPQRQSVQGQGVE